MAMNDVQREHERDFIRRFIDGDPLQLTQTRQRNAGAQAPDLAATNTAFQIGGRSACSGRILYRGEMIELSDFLGQTHPLQQSISDIWHCSLQWR
jgi:hypothetical protein